MRAIFLTTQNCFVRNEPRVAATAAIAATRVTPARDVALIGVGNAECETIDDRVAGRREMKNVFVAIVQGNAAN